MEYMASVEPRLHTKIQYQRNTYAPQASAVFVIWRGHGYSLESDKLGLHPPR